MTERTARPRAYYFDCAPELTRIYWATFLFTRVIDQVATAKSRCRLSLAHRLECRPDLGREQLGLFPGGEVSALVDLIEVGEVRVGLFSPAARGPEDLAGERGKADRELDLGARLPGGVGCLRNLPVMNLVNTPFIGIPGVVDGKVLTEPIGAALRAAWVNFAGSGNPASAAVPWPAFSGAGSAQMLSLMPPQPQIETDFASRHNCAFWAAG